MKKKFAFSNRLIFDLGMNNGDDAEYYLKRNFKVLAIEANPELCDFVNFRFQQAIKSNNLEIVNAAIAMECGHAKFFVNLANDHWSSMDPVWAGRDGTLFKEITVNTVSLGNLFEKYGIPHYMKVDVEGADNIVLEQLKQQNCLPFYLSIEDCRFGYQYLSALASLGYQGFKLLDQSLVPTLKDKSTGHHFKRGSSGPFGEDVPGSWMSINEIEERYAREVRDKNLVRQASKDHWWDIHCRGLVE